MTAKSNSSLVSFGFFSQLCGFIAGALGVVTIVGWLMGWRILTSIRADYIPMAPNTALAFIVLGISLCALITERKCGLKLSRFGTTVIFVLSLIRFTEFTVNINLNVDRWIFQVPGEKLGLVPVGQMALPTTLNFLFASVALFLASSLKKRLFADALTRVLGGLTTFIGLAFSLGYIYGAPLLYGATTIPMAVNTAIAFFLLGLGLVVNNVSHDIAEQKQAAEALRKAHGELEVRVAERTAELVKANEALRAEIIERKRAEEVLRESEERFRELYDNAPVGYHEYDSKGQITRVNRTDLEMLGYTAEEMIGQPIWKFNVGEEIVRQQVSEKLAGSRPPGQNLERTYKRKDGTTFPVLIEDRLIRDENGRIKGMRCTIQDITDRKRAEEALSASEERYRTLFEGAAEGILVADIESRQFKYSNPAICRMLGYTAEELTRLGVEDIHPKEALYHVMAEFEAQARAEKGVATDIPCQRKDGSVIYTSIATTSVVIDGRKCNVGFFMDITDRKHAEDALRRSEEEARRLAQENAIMAEIGRIISSTLDIDEIYQSFSEEVKKIISFDRIVINIIDTEKNTVKNVYMAGKELQNRNVKDVYPLEGSGNAEMVRTKSTFLIQTEDFSEYKDRFPMLLSTFQAGFRSIMNVPLFSKGKIIGGLLLRSRKAYAYTDKDVKLAERIGSQIAGAIANAQLYSERTQAEEEREALQEQLRQSQKMEAIGRLAGGVAHDFNNLLTVIKGYGQLSLAEIKEDNPLRENIEEIRKATDRAVDLTRQLLAFSRRQVMEMRVLDVNAHIQSLDKMLRRLIGEDIQLVSTLAEDLGRVRTDPGQIEQLIMNLAVNARDAMPNGGKLTIETANVDLDGAYARSHVAVTPGRYVMISVSDTGVGMAPEVRDRVFEPFFTTKEKGKGTGLGLSTVYGIVKQSNGNIWVYSEPGKGATFKIYLPRVDEPLEELRKKVVDGELPRGSETIFIVEDEKEVLKLAGRLLKRQGYHVLEASNGEEALKVCKERKESFHLLLTDVVMPQMSGRQLAEQLKRVCQDFKVLYMSGYTDNAITHHGVLERGMNYLQKPFTVEGLAKKVREVLNK